ncbi:MAG: hypothetical protein JNL21_15115 [Myxococcales bacterium]|nr:hypothetical protein [Myxococcales bacterium]
MRRLVSSWLAIAAMLAPLGAHADEPPGAVATDPAAAQSLFDAGRAMMEAGEIEAACAKFEESNRLDPSAGTLLNLGKCFERLNRTASAWAAYKKAIGVGRSKGQTRQVEAAEQFAAEMEPRLSRLLVTVAREVEGLRLFRGETEIVAAARGVPVAVDPGRHELRAEAPGRIPWTKAVDVEPNGQTVTVQIPELAKREAPPPPPVTPPPARGPRLDLVIGGSVVGGLGLVGLGVGAAFGVATLGDASRARDDASLCPEGRCSAEGWAVIQDAESKATVSTALLVVGGLATATGATLVVLGLVLEEPSPGTAAVVPVVGPGVVGLSFGGAL